MKDRNLVAVVVGVVGVVGVAGAVVVVAAGATALGGCEFHAEMGTEPQTAKAVPSASAAPAHSAAASAAAPAASAPASGASPPAPAGRPEKEIPVHLGAGGTAATGTAPMTPAPAAGACLDQGATTVADCATIKAPSPSCAAYTTATQKCAAYKSNFTAKVAASAISCLASSTAAQLCDATRPLACAQTALGQACADTTVAQLCQIAATPCKVTAAACASILSGLSSQGQQAVAQCVATGCSAGLAGCIDTLK